MALEHVISETFCVRENIALAVRVIPLIPEEDIQNNNAHVHIVYPRGNPDNAIFVYAFEGPRIDIIRDFKKELEIYLKEYSPKRLIDYLFFICTYCPVSEKPSVYNFKDFKFTPDPIVDDILKETHGFLLFDFQLEQLISLFIRSQQAVVRTQQGINRRDSLVENRAGRLLFSNGQSLLDVFNERLKMSFAIFPPMASAKTLMEVVNL